MRSTILKFHTAASLILRREHTYDYSVSKSPAKYYYFKLSPAFSSPFHNRRISIAADSSGREGEMEHGRRDIFKIGVINGLDFDAQRY